MKWAALIVRILVGLAFVVFGGIHFIPQPEPQQLPEGFPQAAKDFMAAIGLTHYLTVVKVLEVVGGLLVLSGRLTPLGLVILVPVTVNIALWDALIMGYSMPPVGTILLGLEVFLILAYRSTFAPLWTPNAKVG
jgi:uncharacterized membrane protein YphA (DoxX/SURF4 family)